MKEEQERQKRLCCTCDGNVNIRVPRKVKAAGKEFEQKEESGKCFTDTIKKSVSTHRIKEWLKEEKLSMYTLSILK